MKKSWTKNSHKILEHATSLEKYNRWIVSLFDKHFGKNILEVGSGLGALSKNFPKVKVTLSDVRSDYFNYLKKNFGHKTIKLNIEGNTPKDLKSSYDTIFSSNVFEHIEHDSQALKNSYDLLKKKGKLLLFVPARMEIFGKLDVAMGHYRRYNKSDLVKKAKAAGFSIVCVKYVNLPGFFTWWFRGRFPSSSSGDGLLSALFDTFIVPIIYLEKYISVPFGQSLMMVAKKD